MLVASNFSLIMALSLLLRLLMSLPQIPFVSLNDHHWRNKTCRRPDKNRDVIKNSRTRRCKVQLTPSPDEASRCQDRCDNVPHDSPRLPSPLGSDHARDGDLNYATRARRHC